ncbi:MAG: hypothetical protein M0R33_08425 [Methylomonas sp.]|uniref:hypothetical protein n=1 Tax=Methylomonas sp. TaxID=418 RepID=UPI0025E14CBB|nr:hypothetical protein [Methylomonas sp.]MCK9606462.1 hypothetical protein [Methylomonas sp.]
MAVRPAGEAGRQLGAMAESSPTAGQVSMRSEAGIRCPVAGSDFPGRKDDQEGLFYHFTLAAC